jgi:hypothetical protein
LPTILLSLLVSDTSALQCFIPGHALELYSCPLLAIATVAGAFTIAAAFTTATTVLLLLSSPLYVTSSAHSHNEKDQKEARPSLEKSILLGQVLQQQGQPIYSQKEGASTPIIADLHANEVLCLHQS